MKKVLFINGQREEIANIFCETAPEGFDVSWRPYSLNDNEKAGMIKDVEFLVLHPAVVSQSLLREAKFLRLIQLLTAGYDQIDLELTAELGIPVATNGGANALASISTDNHLPKRDGVCWPSQSGVGFGIERFDCAPGRDR